MNIENIIILITITFVTIIGIIKFIAEYNIRKKIAPYIKQKYPDAAKKLDITSGEFTLNPFRILGWNSWVLKIFFVGNYINKSDKKLNNYIKNIRILYIMYFLAILFGVLFIINLFEYIIG